MVRSKGKAAKGCGGFDERQGYVRGYIQPIPESWPCAE